METFVYISCVVFGAALGAGGDWFFWQARFKQAEEKMQEEGKAVGESFNTQVAEKDKQLETVRSELETMRSERDAARNEVDALKKRLEEESRQLVEAQELNRKLPGLEKEVVDQKAEITRLLADNQEATETIDELRLKIVEDRKAFEGGLVYVQGGHYLPASVVRNLTHRGEQDKS